jgi:hypothetical protein
MPPMSSHIRCGDEATQRGARFEQSLDRHDAGYDVSCLIPYEWRTKADNHASGLETQLPKNIMRFLNL